MFTYLRFTRLEFVALTQACRPIHLSDDVFPSFKPFLLQALATLLPDLAARIAGFKKYQLGILFEGLKERRDAAARRAPAGGSARPALTARECLEVLQACGSCVFHGRFLASFQGFLVHHFRKGSPDLAAKLSRLTDRQVEWLHGQVRRRRRPRA